VSDGNLAPGEAFGPYRIESVLGRGGMGAVYLATQERLGRKVALKLIAPELAHAEDFRARFLRESQLAASLDHPNVIPIYDAGEVDGVLYLAMRYVDGESLQSTLRAGGSLSVEKTERLARQIGAALDAAHAAGLVHRDVKPANILLAERGEHAYLCDFGLAKHASSHGITHAGSFLGTIDYCAPEQIRGGPIDGRADIYSLGGVLYHCLAGQPPFARDSDLAVLNAHLNDPPPALSTVRPDLPTAIDSVIARSMAKESIARYPTGAALAGALAQAAGDGATRAAPPAFEPVTAALPRPRRRRLGAIAAVAVIAAGAIIAAVVASRNSNSDATGLRTFVDRIENVLDQSADGRREIRSALAGGFDCSLPPREAGRRIASVADNRQSILVQLGSIPAPTQRANEMVTLLQRALQQSIEADRRYRDGFFAVTASTRCPLHSNGAFALAKASDAKASDAKRRFAAAFDPLARRFHRRVWAASQI
jgi:serine/threonine protein kinase